MSSNTVFASVPNFDGSNYRQWADRMQAYLQMNNLWGVTNGDEEQLEDLSPTPGAAASDPPIQPSQGDIAERSKLQRNWSRDNEAVIGILTLKIRQDLWTLKKNTAKEMWDEMASTYGTVSQAQKFQWLKELFRFKLPGSESPHKEFGRWDVLLDKLTKGGLTLPDEVLSSILMADVPATYKAAESLFLAAVSEDKLTSKVIKELYITEWERKRPGHQRQQTKVANRISAVKQKGQTPTFQQQQQPQQKASSSHQRADQSGPQQEWKQRSKRGGAKNKKKTKPAAKGKGKGRAYVADGESTDSGDHLFATAALAENSQVGDVALPFNIIPPISDPAVKKTTPRMTAGGSGMFASGSHFRTDESEAQRQQEFHRISTTGVPGDKDALLGVLSFGKEQQVPEGYGVSLTSGRFADYKPQDVGFADYSRNKAPGETLKRLSWVLPVGPFPPLGTPGPVVPPSTSQASRATDKRLSSVRVPGSSIIEIGRRGATTTRTVANDPQVQKKSTPPSIYPCVRKARQIKDRLDLVGTTQVMKNLELTSMMEDEEMAPRDMTAEPARLEGIDEDDVVSIGSQPDESRKRPASPIADDERESSEFTRLLEQFAADQKSQAERQKLSWADDADLDLFGDNSDGEDPCVVLSYEDTLVPVPKLAFPHYDKVGRVRQMCLQKGISFIQPNLDKYAGEGKGIIVKVCGHFDVINSEEPFYIPQGYCLVDQGSGLEMHYGEIPRVEAKKGYFWAKNPKGVWELQWKVWQGTLSYTDEAYAQECAEDSIMGSILD